ncbi:MAG: glucose-1-phosphate adenylyltransferase subunit GlgD, partial [Chloroflexi bacterium]|nr:glucose-1-phosphate adenylyltransferase subunit GlgD [Chloroflexota bacterium]
LAGGQSPGLGVLTALRNSAALPFGGKYRIIDFTLSNCVNSGLYDVAVLTQYEPRSLNEHIGIGKPWDLDRARGGVRLLQPYQSHRGDAGVWQEGSADAVRFNLDVVVEQKADHVLILSGDHVYKMDYQPLLRRHNESGADVTLAVRAVSPHDTHRFGMVSLDSGGRVTDFEEKPQRTHSTLSSMGIYVFRREALIDWLTGEGRAHHDFGREVMPALLKRRRVMAYAFQGYWDDVGTAQSYWEANMALLAETPALDLYHPEWVIHTRSEEQPAALVGPDARVDGNLLCDGCRVDGQVSRSVIAPGVYIAPGAVVRDSIIMHDSVIGEGAALDRVIVDKQVVIGGGARIGGGDDTPSRRAPQRLNTGLTLIGKGTRVPPGLRVGRNVEIGVNLHESAFPPHAIASGETIPE